MTKSQQLKAKELFFAGYYGQKVLFIPDDEVESIGKYSVTVNSPFLDLISNGRCQETYLQLTSLSNISDEDATNLAKLRGFVNVKKVYISDNGYWVYWRGESGVLKRKSFTFYGDMYLPETSFLKSRSFALDYYCPIENKVITVEEQVNRKWIKIKEE